MDNITHTMLGVGLAKAGLSKRFGKGATLFMVIASNLPDLDVFWAAVQGGDSFMHRRMFTHSFLGFPLIAFLAALLFRRFYKHIPLKHFFWMGLLAMAVHVFYDVVNSYGVVLLYPFDKTRYELGWVFIIDLALWGLVCLPFLLRMLPFRWASSENAFRISLTLIVCYTLLCGLSRQVSALILKKNTAHQPAPLEFSTVFPEPLGPHRFKGVQRNGNRYSIYLIDVLAGKAALKKIIETEVDRPPIPAIRETQEARNLEWFFKAPVWKASANPGHLIDVFDLRFKSLVLTGRRMPFQFQFSIDGEKISYLGRKRS